MSEHPIRVGIGGWSYAPWRETFYPPEVPKARELEYASTRVSAIEINSTFYGPQKPATFEKWREQTPAGFLFSLKAPRIATHRRDLREAGDSVRRFTEGGLAQLRHKLGPIVWQFAATKTFDAAEFEAFLALLPAEIEGLPLRHALDVRHASFAHADFVRLAQRHRAAIVHTDATDAPAIADATADFVYLRLREAQARLTTGYSLPALRRWAEAVRAWRDGGIPKGLESPLAPPVRSGPGKPRDTFVYFINGAKERAPAAAVRLIELLGEDAAPPAAPPGGAALGRKGSYRFPHRLE